MTKKEHAFCRRILTDSEITAFAQHMRKAMGPTFAVIADGHDLSIEDTLRFQSLVFRLAEARSAKGLLLKEVAASLKVPKYRLDDIENASLRNIRPEIAMRYVEFLGLKTWFGRWKKANLKLATQMGFTEIGKPVSATSREKKKRSII